MTKEGGQRRCALATAMDQGITVGERPRINVLLFSGEADTREALRRWVGRLTTGEIVEADTAAAAFQRLVRAPSDLLLADLEMANVDGLRIVTLIRSSPKMDRVTIGVLSHVRTEEAVRAAVSAGVSDYFLKPLVFGRAIHRLTRLVELADKRLQQAERREAPGPEPRKAPVILLSGNDANKAVLTPEQEDRRWNFVACRSAAETMINARGRKADIVLLASFPPALGLAAYASKLREVCQPRSARMVALGGSERPAGQEGVEVVRQPTSDAELVELLARLVDEYHTAQLPARERLEAALRRELIRTLGRFFATYTGSSPTEGDGEGDYGASWVGGKVSVEAADGSFGMDVWLAGERSAVGAVAQAMFAEDGEADEDMLVEVAQELLNSAAGAAKTIAEKIRISVRVGIPAVALGAAKPALSGSAKGCGSLDWNGTGAWNLWLASRERSGAGK